MACESAQEEDEVAKLADSESDSPPPSFLPPESKDDDLSSKGSVEEKVQAASVWDDDCHDAGFDSDLFVRKGSGGNSPVPPSGWESDPFKDNAERNGPWDVTDKDSPQPAARPPAIAPPPSSSHHQNLFGNSGAKFPPRPLRTVSSSSSLSGLPSMAPVTPPHTPGATSTMLRSSSTCSSPRVSRAPPPSPMMSNHCCPSTPSSLTPSAVHRRRKKLMALGRQLSLNGLRRRLVGRTSSDPAGGDASDEEENHLLEEVEPVAALCCELASPGLPLKEEEEEATVSKLQIPSSLVTLNEAEKRQLEEVLMRIGLKDCGL